MTFPNVRATTAELSVYLLYDADDMLLYVGTTMDPERRLAAHRSSKKWGRTITSMTWCDLPREEALVEERELISALRPKFNGTWNPTRPTDLGDKYVPVRIHRDLYEAIKTVAEKEDRTIITVIRRAWELYEKTVGGKVKK